MILVTCLSFALIVIGTAIRFGGAYDDQARINLGTRILLAGIALLMVIVAVSIARLFPY